MAMLNSLSDTFFMEMKSEEGFGKTHNSLLAIISSTPVKDPNVNLRMSEVTILSVLPVWYFKIKLLPEKVIFLKSVNSMLLSVPSHFFSSNELV